MNYCKVPFEEAGIQVRPCCSNNKDRIDVGCYDLVCTVNSRNTAGKRCLPGKDIYDGIRPGIGLVKHYDKITDNRKPAKTAQCAGDPGMDKTPLNKNFPESPLPARDPSGNAGTGIFCEC